MFVVVGCGTTSTSSKPIIEVINNTSTQEENSTEKVAVSQEETTTITPTPTTDKVKPECQRLKQFPAAEVEAGRCDSDSKFKITDLNMNTDERDTYSVGDYCDLDNDDEYET